MRAPNRTDKQRSNCMSRSLSWLFLVGAVAGAKPGLATEVRRFTLVHRSDSACPGEASLLAEIQRRAPSALRVAGPSRDVETSVTVEGSGPEVRAHVIVQRAEGSSQREVKGRSCEEVNRAAALIIALALDPDADVGEGPGTGAIDSALPLATRSTASSVIANERPERSLVFMRKPTEWWMGVGLVAGATTGVSPDPALVVGAFVEARERSAALLAARFRLSGLRAKDDAKTVAGSAGLSLLALRAAACPVAVGVQLTVDACATFDLGHLKGDGGDALDSKQKAATWFGPGAALRAGALVNDVLSFGVELGAMAPLSRDRFYFRPDITVHRIPAFASYGNLWLGLGGTL